MERRALLAGGAVVAAAAIGAATQSEAAEPSIWSARYTATKISTDGTKVELAIYRKRSAPPDGKPRPVLFLVHGSSVSALPSFDLDVPGRADVSLMNVCAGWGYDVWTMDHENYGRSTRTTTNSNIASGVEDLKAAAEVVLRETGQRRMHMMGESSGALRAGAFAAAAPDRIGRLVLQAVTYTGTGSDTLEKRAKQVEYYKTHNTRPREEAMLRSIFTRDKPGLTDPDVIEAFVKAEMVYGNTIPTGTYLDMTANLPVVHPEQVQAPVLLVNGQYDGIASLEDICEFFRRLPSGDKQITIVPGAAHSLTSSQQRFTFWKVLKNWLER